ncbi:MAG: helix-turn-helix transcriptional regulator [Saccharothrix sp.]|nr:helix-turn-helix transcriptional regulator [Saccharothrix sp.]
MATKRRYGDRCGVAHALDVLGERWALLVVRDLLLGPKRFTDLQAGLPGAGPNVLTTRLADLQRAGVVQRRTLPPPAGSRVYELTEWGTELKPIVLALGLWGARSPVLKPEGELRPDSMMLSLLGLADPAALGHRVVEVRLGHDTFTVTTGDAVHVSRGQSTGPVDAVVDTDGTTLAALMEGEDDLESAITAGRVSLGGDEASGRALLDAVCGANVSAVR